MCIYDNNKNCAILVGKPCLNCKFALTQEQADAKLQKKYARFRKMPEHIQQYIAGKYYCGVMEWQN